MNYLHGYNLYCVCTLVCVRLCFHLGVVLLCVCVEADRLVNSVCLLADSSQGSDLFLSLEAEAAHCLMSPPGRDRRRDGELLGEVVGGGIGFCYFAMWKLLFQVNINYILG